MSGVLNTIPASTIVNVIPSVLNAGGDGLDLIGLMLSSSNRAPIGTVLSFPNSTAVDNYFGATSMEAIDAGIYFGGFNGATQLPGAMLAASYPTVNVGAWMRGGQISGLSLTQLQALSGVLTVSLDGTPHTSSSISLSSAPSFSNAAQLITNALGTIGETQATVTASIGADFTGTATGTSLVVTAVTGVIHPGDTITGIGISGTVTIVSQSSGTTGAAGTYITSASTTASSASIGATSTTLDITAVASGTIVIGQELQGDSIAAGTYITAFGTGTGNTGTYIVTSAQNLGSGTMTMVMPTVTYDTLSGSFVVSSATTGAASTISFGTGTISASLLLTSATGAVLSQGANAAVPATFMNGITAITQNWATFWCSFNPDLQTGLNVVKQAFAAWVNSPSNGQVNRYVYIADDTDITPTESTQATTSLGYILQRSLSSGTVVNYQPTALHLAAFVASYAASLDFTATNGRSTAAFKFQDGLGISVTNASAAANLLANGYNFTGDYATANQNFQWYFNGSVSGPFQWLDSYLDQIWLNAALQLALMELLNNVKSIPYNPAGYGLIRQACLDPINAAVNFGAIRTGIPLSAAQAAEVNISAGLNIATVLQTQGWYLQILAATAQVRQGRGTPPMTLWFADGGSIQALNLASVLIQ